MNSEQRPIKQANCDDCGQVGVPVIIAGVQCGWRGQRDGRDFAKDNNGGRICRTCWDKYDREAKEQQLQETRRMRVLEFRASIPEDYRDASIEDAIGPIKQAVLQWSGETKHPILFMSGSAGVGKTRAAWAIVRESKERLLKGGVSDDFTWVDMPLLSSRLMSWTIQERGREIVRIAESPGILVLDDFGNETPVIRADLYPIIHHRSQWSLKTVITSEYTIEQIGQVDAFGARWTSRLSQGVCVSVKAKDRRPITR